MRYRRPRASGGRRKSNKYEEDDSDHEESSSAGEEDDQDEDGQEDATEAKSASSSDEGGEERRPRRDARTKANVSHGHLFFRLFWDSFAGNLYTGEDQAAGQEEAREEKGLSKYCTDPRKTLVT